MSIKSVDERGFVVTTTFEGETVGEVRFEYADLGLSSDVQPLALWAIRNGFSQALVDTGAGKTLADRREAFAKKVARFNEGHVPSESGGRGPQLSPLERELRAVVAAVMRAYVKKPADAAKIAKDPAKAAEALAAAMARSTKMAESDKRTAEELLADWEAKAHRRLQELQEQPEMDIEL